jgi:hypothetical protein
MDGIPADSFLDHHLEGDVIRKIRQEDGDLHAVPGDNGGADDFGPGAGVVKIDLPVGGRAGDGEGDRRVPRGWGKGFPLNTRVIHLWAVFLPAIIDPEGFGNLQGLYRLHGIIFSSM